MAFPNVVSADPRPHTQECPLLQEGQRLIAARTSASLSSLFVMVYKSQCQADLLWDSDKYVEKWMVCFSA